MSRLASSPGDRNCSIPAMLPSSSLSAASPRASSLFSSDWPCPCLKSQDSGPLLNLGTLILAHPRGNPPGEEGIRKAGGWGKSLNAVEALESTAQGSALLPTAAGQPIGGEQDWLRGGVPPPRMKASACCVWQWHHVGLAASGGGGGELHRGVRELRQGFPRGGIS